MIQRKWTEHKINRILADNAKEFRTGHSGLPPNHGPGRLFTVLPEENVMPPIIRIYAGHTVSGQIAIVLETELQVLQPRRKLPGIFFALEFPGTLSLVIDGDLSYRIRRELSPRCNDPVEQIRDFVRHIIRLKLKLESPTPHTPHSACAEQE